jgi:hypothetical protein
MDFDAKHNFKVVAKWLKDNTVKVGQHSNLGVAITKP